MTNNIGDDTATRPQPARRPPASRPSIARTQPVEKLASSVDQDDLEQMKQSLESPIESQPIQRSASHERAEEDVANVCL